MAYPYYDQACHAVPQPGSVLPPYVDHVAETTLTLTNLFGSSVPFIWSPAVDAAFYAHQSALSSAKVLHIFDPSLLISVATDASGFALGTILFQTDEHGKS